VGLATPPAIKVSLFVLKKSREMAAEQI
jgi:hypothetical protein